MSLTFEQNGREVNKSFKISDCARRVAIDIESEATRTIMKYCLEAERDFAYMEFGDKWREHITGNFFTSPPSEIEMAIIEDAKRMLCA